MKIDDSKIRQHREYGIGTLNILQEWAGTLFIVLVGCGLSITSGAQIGVLGTALGFSAIYAGVVLVFGGFHRVQCNPGLSLAIAISGIDVASYARHAHSGEASLPDCKIGPLWLLAKVLAQLLGALCGAVLLLWLIQSKINPVDIGAHGLAQNGWGRNVGEGYKIWGAIIVEVTGATLLFAVIVRGLRLRWSAPAIAAIAALVFLAAYLFCYRVTGASLNFARSFGPELISWSARFMGEQGGVLSDAALVALKNALIELGVFFLVSLTSGLLAGVFCRKIGKRL